MKIISLSVKNYKSLFDFKITGFDDINFIQGCNNSGKSNFLYLLNLIFQRKSIAIDTDYRDDGGILRKRREIQEQPFWSGMIYDMPFLFSNDDRKKPIEFEVGVSLDAKEIFNIEALKESKYIGKEPKILIEIQGEIKSTNQFDSSFKLKEVKLKGHKIYSDSGGAPEFFREPENSMLRDSESAFSETMSALNDCIIFIDSDRAFKNEAFQNASSNTLFSASKFKSWLHNISLDSDAYDKYQGLIKFLDSFKISKDLSTTVLKDNLKSFPFTNTKIDFSRFKDEIEVMLTNDLGRFPLKNYGTGVQQIFYILSRIFDSNGKILLIEELELNLSQEYQDLLIDNFKAFIEKSQINQVFFTSHSDYLLRSDFVVFQIDIDGKGQSHMKKSEYDEATRQFRRSLMPYVQVAEKAARKKEGL